MPDEGKVFDELRGLLAGAPVGDLPELLGRLEAERLRGVARLTTPANGTQHAETSAPDRLLTLPEVAALLGVPVEHARELGRRGAIPTVRVGERYVRVRRSALDRFLRERERGAVIGTASAVLGRRIRSRPQPGAGTGR